jgi:hypothetical protein
MGGVGADEYIGPLRVLKNQVADERPIELGFENPGVPDPWARDRRQVPRFRLSPRIRVEINPIGNESDIGIQRPLLVEQTA